MNKFLGFAKKVAPWITTAVTGGIPGLVSMAATTVGGIVNKKLGTADEVVQAIASATPEQQIALKAQDQAFQEHMAKINYQTLEDLEKMSMDDTANARAREIAVKDWTPELLTVALTVGFFGLIIALLKLPIPEANAATVYTMLGILGSGFMAAVNYYLGSSQGSRAKDAVISTMSVTAAKK